MPTNHGLVLLYADDSDFIDYAAVHLRSLGLTLTPVLTQDELLRAIRDERPALVLVHWDTLGDAALRFCAFLKQSLLRRAAPVAVVREGSGDGRFVMKAFASGADELIEDALEPRLFAARLRALLRWAPPEQPAVELGTAP